MKKYKSKIGPVYLTLTILLILISVGLVALCVYRTITDYANDILIKTLGIFIGGFATVVLAGPLFRTYYIFRDDYLYMVSGTNKVALSYRAIYKVSEAKKFFSRYGLAFTRMAISYKEFGRDGENYEDVFYPSPKEYDEFLVELKKHVKNLKVEK